MDRNEQLIEQVKADVIRGFGVLADNTNPFKFEGTGHQKTVAVKTCKIKPKLVLSKEKDTPASAAQHPNLPDSDTALQNANDFLNAERQDLSAYYGEIDEILNKEPAKILSLSEDQGSQYRLSFKSNARYKGISTCDSCKGSCTACCARCNGSGNTKCSNCKATGQVKHYYQVSRKVPCMGCYGTGKMPSSAGPVPCSGCIGGLKLIWENTYKWVGCNNCTSSGYVKCQNCSGKGKVDCKSCDAKGAFLSEYIVAAHLSMENETVYEHLPINGTTVKFKPNSDMEPESVAYEKIESSEGDVIAGRETKEYSTSQVSLKHPKLGPGAFFITGTSDRYFIHNRTPGVGDGLIKEFLGKEGSSSIKKTAKLIDHLHQIPALKNESLKLFSEEAKNRIKALKSDFSIGVYKAAKRKRFSIMVAVWPVTLFVVSLLSILLQFFLSDMFHVNDFFDKRGEPVFGTLLVIAVFALLAGAAAMKLVVMGDIEAPGKKTPKKEVIPILIRIAVSTLTALSVAMLLYTLFLLMKPSWDLPAGLTTTIVISIIVGLSALPSLVLARAFCGGRARKFQKRMMLERG